MSTLEFHPDGAKRIAEVAQKLAENIARSAKPVEDVDGDTFQPDVVVDHTIHVRDLVDLQVNEVRDPTGQEVQRSLIVDSQSVCIAGETLAEFHSLCQRVVKEKSFRELVTLKCVTKAIHSWIQSRMNGDKVPSLPVHLIAELGKDVGVHEVWVPLPNLSIQSTIPVAKGTLRPVTGETIAYWKRRIPRSKGREKDRARYQKVFDLHRRELQGYTAGVFTVTGNSERASEIGVELTQNAIAALRLFHPGCVEPTAVCATDVKYAATREAYTVISFTKTHAEFASMSLPGAVPPWSLADGQIQAIRSGGLDDVYALLDQDEPSSFTREYIAALKIYSRAPLWVDLADRLLYILIPLESLFLKSQTESIQQNLGERLAWYIGGSLKERKKIVGAVRSAYDQRSSFVHHAQNISDTHDLREFMMYAWTAMFSLPRAIPAYRDRQHFLSDLDDRKLS